MIMGEAETISADHVRQALPRLESPASVSAASTPANAEAAHDLESGEALSLRDRVENFERQLLSRVFQQVRGNVSEMARRLRTDRANLHRKLQRYSIK
jgi:DNA-binding NtrC family response regulator